MQSGGAPNFYLSQIGPGSRRAQGRARTGGAPSRWFGSAIGSGGQGRVFGLCARGTTARLVVHTIGLGATDTGRDVLRCGRGELALGGGVVARGGNTNFELHASGPLDSSKHPEGTRTGDRPLQWFVEWQNLAGPTTFQTSVVCVKRSRVRVKVADLTLNGTTDDLSVACDSGKRIVGGGMVPLDLVEPSVMHASGPLDASGTTLETDDGDVARQWYAFIGSDVVGEQRYRVFGICE